MSTEYSHMREMELRRLLELDDTSFYEAYEKLPYSAKEVIDTFDLDADPYMEWNRINQELKDHGFKVDYDLTGEATKIEML